MVACANGDRDTAVVYLLRKGADPNAANAAQRRAVDFARQNNRFSTVQLLELATEATHQRELRCPRSPRFPLALVWVQLNYPDKCQLNYPRHAGRKWRESTGAARRALPSCCSARPRSKGSSAAGWQRQAGADLSFANIR
jgi:hypothetical protein